MDSFKKGWFTENGEGWDGMAQSLEVSEVVHSEKSKFQEIAIFRSKRVGLVMTLDGVFQSTELDEFAYQEMMSHVALYAHPDPKRVLIVGGGDCGVAREVLKHKCVEVVDQCEIDERVVELSKKFLPHMASEAVKDPRLNIHYEDGAKFVASKTDYYDIIITDSSDPIGPGEILFRKEYYQSLYNALKADGIAVSQGESPWFNAPLIYKLRDSCKEIGFKNIEYSIIQVPTYPGGSIGAFIASKGNSCKNPVRKMTPEETSKMKYYNEETHIGSFSLPEFFRKEFYQ